VLPDSLGQIYCVVVPVVADTKYFLRSTVYSSAAVKVGATERRASGGRLPTGPAGKHRKADGLLTLVNAARAGPVLVTGSPVVAGGETG